MAVGNGRPRFLIPSVPFAWHLSSLAESPTKLAASTGWRLSDQSAHGRRKVHTDPCFGDVKERGRPPRFAEASTKNEFNWPRPLYCAFIASRHIKYNIL